MNLMPCVKYDAIVQKKKFLPPNMIVNDNSESRIRFSSFFVCEKKIEG